MMPISKEGETPTSVPPTARQVGERSQQVPSEPTVWTERMLSALEKGVKGGMWFSLSDKAFGVRCLEAAFKKVKSNGGSAGSDHVTIAQFESRLPQELEYLSKALMDGSYRPQAIRRVWIPKPGSKEKRPLGIPTVRDRVVQCAIRFAIEPIFEKEFQDTSFGFRPGRSCHQALRRVWLALKAGRTTVVDADLKKCFDTIPHGLIMRGIEGKISDGTLLSVIRLLLKQGVMQTDEENAWGSEPEMGTPQGSVLSPLLANIALQGLDVAAQAHHLELIRYADDFVVMCSDKEQAEHALEVVKAWSQTNGMNLHPGKTRIVDYLAGESFVFLGHEFVNGYVHPRKTSKQNVQAKIRSLTPRKSGKSLAVIIQALNPILRGWFSYYRHCHPWCFQNIDGFTRRRLRAMLAQNLGKEWHGHQQANAKWRNSYFHEMGLFSMELAYIKSQSSKR